MNLLPILVFSLPFANGLAPTTTGALDYTVSTVSGGSRVGSYWPLTGSGGQYDAFAGAGSTPPRGSAFVPELVLSDPGLEAHNETTSPKVASDSAVRTNGRDGSGILISNFSSETDKCLANPGQCDLADADGYTGFSAAFWVNIPAELNIYNNYLLDTGGDEIGNPGLAVVLKGSSDGSKNSQLISVLVSTGDRYWKVILNGMTIPNAWNNIGIRWSPSGNKDDTAINGLQVFVNGTSVAWKRSPYVSGAAAVVKTASEANVAIGCRVDGTSCARAKFDNLVFWYWALRNTAGFSNADNAGQIPFFRGNRQVASAFSTEQDPVARNGYPAPGDLLDPDFVPWLYTYEMDRLARLALADESFLDDRSPATEGDCEPENPSSWNSYGHPMACADTRKELENALNYDDKYTGPNLVRAMVRVINRNQLSEIDLAFLAGEPLVKMQEKLKEDVKKGPELGWDEVGKYYAWFAFAISQLQIGEYEDIFKRKMEEEKQEGLSQWVRALTELNLLVSSNMTENKAIQIEANNTVTAVMRTRKNQITSGVHFPDYELETSVLSFHISQPHLFRVRVRKFFG